MSGIPSGVVCSFRDYERSLKDHSISCLTRADSIGLTVTVQAGVLSLLAILYVFLVIGRNVLWRVHHMSAARLRIFHQPMDILMFTLFLADTIQAVGMVMSIKWVRDGKVEVGRTCTAQGLIKMFGATTVALSTLLIALYTFISVWMMKGISSMKITLILAVGVGVSTAILAGVALATHTEPSKPSLMGPTPYWCWVNAHYMEWRVLGEYLWMWITLFFSLLVYIPLYFWMRGNITFSWWKFSFSTPREPFPRRYARRRQSLVMLVYPGIYCLSIMPLSIVRWIAFVQESRHGGISHMPSAATLCAEAIFGLSGFFNVVLLLTTKPGSGLFGQLMFISPAQPPLNTSDPYRDERSMDNEYQLGKFPPCADCTISS